VTGERRNRAVARSTRCGCAAVAVVTARKPLPAAKGPISCPEAISAVDVS
jgi:hypothetical protein